MYNLSYAANSRYLNLTSFDIKLIRRRYLRRFRTLPNPHSQGCTLSKRKTEAVVKPGAAADDLRREAVAFVQAATHERTP